MTENTSQKSSLGCLPLVGIAALVVMGGGYFAWGKLIGKPLTPLESAKVVPESALLTSFVSTDIGHWSKLEQFGTPEAQELFQDSFQESKKILSEDSIDYNQDIQPWLGGTAIAILPGTKANGDNTDFLMVLGVKNKLQLWKFANKVKEDAELVKTKYKGVEISETNSSTDEQYSFAMVDNKVLFSNQRQTLEQAIDTIQGAPSFADKLGSKQILTKGINLKNPLAQLYISDYSKSIKDLLELYPDNRDISARALDTLNQVESLVVGVGIEPQGIRLKSATKLNSDNNILKVLQPSSSKIIDKFPEKTIMLINGQGISKAWLSIVSEIESEPQLKDILNEGRSFFKSLGFDLDQDIFGWMDGEFAVGLISSRQGILANFGFGGVVVLETSDRSTSEATMKKIQAIAQGDYPFFEITNRTVEGQNFTEWNVPLQGALFGYGWLPDDSLVLALGGSLLDTMTKESASSLRDNPRFKTVANSLPKQNFGYLYLDMAEVMVLINNLQQFQTSLLSPEIKIIIESIEGIGMTTNARDDSTSNIEVLFNLKSSK